MLSGEAARIQPAAGSRRCAVELDLIATRAIDMARHLNATIITKATSILAALNPSLSAHAAFAHAGALPCRFSAGDFRRPSYVLVAACLAAMNGVEIGALL